MYTKLSRRRAIATLSAALAAGTLMATSTVHAQAPWPSKPIRWVIPYAPGGTSDILARAVAQKMSERLGQPVLIENKAGAGGNVGTDFVAKAPADGYTWVLGNIGPMAVNVTMYKNLPYDPEKDLTPISLLLSYPNVVLVNNNGPATLKDLIQLAKNTNVAYAGNGVGTSLHLTGEMLARSGGMKLQHVPYKGDAPGITDTIAGVVPMAIMPIASAVPMAKAGRLRALAVTGSERSSLLPDVPTVAEAGVPGFEVTGWVGLLVPRGTPAPIVSRLVDEIGGVMQTPDIKRLVGEMASVVPPMGPDHFAKFIRSETVKWREVVNGANLKAD